MNGGNLEQSGTDHDDKQPEETLRDNDGKLNAILAAIPDHISVLDSELNIVWANAIATGAFGKDIIGRKCYEAYHRRSEPCEPYPCLVLKTFKDGKAYEHDTEVVDKEGNTIYFHCTSNVASRDKDNQPVTVLEISRDITSRKEAEEIAEKSELRLRQVTSGMPGMVYQFYARPDGNFGVHYVSDQTRRLFGLQPDAEVFFKHFTDLVIPECREDFLESIRKAVNEFTAWQYEGQLRKPSGEIVWFRGESIPVQGEHEILFNGVLLDITDRKRAEEALNDSERRYRALFENTGTATVIIEGDTVISLCNAEFERLTGCSRNEIEGKRSFAEFVHGEDAARVLAQHRVRREGRGRALQRYEFRLIRWDGEIRNIYLVVDIIPGMDRAVASLTDITERKKMEEELKAHRNDLGRLVAERTAAIQEEVARRKAKEQQYLSLVESMVEWVWETDANFVLTYVSPRIQDVLGYGPEELVGRSPADIMPPGEAARAIPLIRRVFSEKENFISFETVHIHKDGRLIFIEANGTPYFDQEGGLLGYRGSCHDITEKKQLIDAMKEHEQDLTIKSKNLEEINAALRVLLNQREEDRRELEGKFVANVRQMVLPYILKIPRMSLDSRCKTYLDIAMANLNEIVSPFLNSVRQMNFTPREIEVASLIKEGKTTKEIAEIMGVAPSAVNSHRDNIRKKLNLNNKKANLRSHLMSLK